MIIMYTHVKLLQLHCSMYLCLPVYKPKLLVMVFTSLSEYLPSVARPLIASYGLQILNIEFNVCHMLGPSGHTGIQDGVQTHAA